MIDYEEFIRISDYERQKYEIIDTIFVTMQACCMNLKVRTIKELFTKVCPQY